MGVVFGSDAKHQVSSNNTTAHVVADHKGQASEHSTFANVVVTLGEDASYASCQSFVKSHRATILLEFPQPHVAERNGRAGIAVCLEQDR